MKDKSPAVWYIYCILLIICCLNCKAAYCQADSNQPLYKTIVYEDSLMFNAFNNRDLETIKKMFSDNLEFYHDRDGLTSYQTVMKSFENVFKGTIRVRREVVPGTIEVYPIPNYGAVEIGIHKFTAIQDGKEATSLYKFIHTWQLKDNEWKITRAVSVGH